MAKSEGANLARDFDYLMPFLEKVQAAGEALSPSARVELEALMRGERQRWERIRELLSAAGAGRAPASPRSAPAPQEPSPRTPAPFGLTVGSLREPSS